MCSISRYLGCHLEVRERDCPQVVNSLSNCVIAHVFSFFSVYTYLWVLLISAEMIPIPVQDKNMTLTLSCLHHSLSHGNSPGLSLTEDPALGHHSSKHIWRWKRWGRVFFPDMFWHSHCWECEESPPKTTLSCWYFVRYWNSSIGTEYRYKMKYITNTAHNCLLFFPYYISFFLSCSLNYTTCKL